MPKLKKTNSALRGAIIAAFGSQADWAQVIGCDPAKVSHVLANRHKLTVDESYTWQRILGCDLALLKPVTRSQ